MGFPENQNTISILIFYEYVTAGRTALICSFETDVRVEKALPGKVKKKDCSVSACSRQTARVRKNMRG